VLAEAEELADDVVVIQRGTIVAHGTPAELKRSTQGERFRIRLAKGLKKYEAVFKGLAVENVAFTDGLIDFRTKDPVATNPEIVRRLVAAGADVIGVAVAAPTLQEAYVDIVRSARDAG
jgi:ABC-type multidrug transport system ATPase subunit